MHTRDEYLTAIQHGYVVGNESAIYNAIRPLIDDDIDEAIYGSKDPD